MNALKTIIRVGCLCASTTSLSLAQTTIHHLVGDSPDDRLGRAESAGDVNGDGVPDLIAFAWGVEPAGMVRVYSGMTGETLHTILGTDPDEDFGCCTSGVGDVDADGYDDFGYGMQENGFIAPGAGSACVRSGFDGTLLYQFYGGAQTDHFGYRMDGAGDLDQDGHDDIIIGLPQNDIQGQNAGAVQVFSGADGSILYTWYGDNANDQLGREVAGIGDVNDDGGDDVAVGAWGSNGPYYGYVKIYSGTNGQELLHVPGPTTPARFASSINAAGDVNGDGCTDLIVGAPEYDLIEDRAGAAFIYDGLTGALIFSVLGEDDFDHFGATVDGLGDIDLDGFDDVVISSPYDCVTGSSSKEGSVTLISGRDASVIEKYWGPNSRDYLSSGAGAGDVNLDGVPDIIVGSSGDDTGGIDAGSIRVYSGNDCSKIQNYCATSPNSAGPGAVMSYTGLPGISQNDFTLLCTGVPDEQFGMFFYGLYQGDIPFGNGVRCTAGQIFRFGVIKSQGNTLVQPVDVTQPPHANGQITVGSEWNFQCWFRDPGEGPAFFNLSDGLNVIFCR